MEAEKEPLSTKPFKPMRALVLPGGGGRGAYQVGVVKALLERGIEFDLAFGTSIGGINAALLAASILSVKYRNIHHKLTKYRNNFEKKVPKKPF